MIAGKLDFSRITLTSPRSPLAFQHRRYFCGVFGCQNQSLPTSRPTTGLALGASAPWQFGNWGLRAEYERFTAYGGPPGQV